MENGERNGGRWEDIADVRLRPGTVVVVVVGDGGHWWDRPLGNGRRQRDNGDFATSSPCSRPIFVVDISI